MADFKDWCRQFVIIVIIGGVLEYIIKPGNLYNAYKTLFSVALVAVILVPFTKGDINLINEIFYEGNQIAKSELINKRDDIISEVTIDSVKNVINEYLYKINRNAGVSYIDLRFSDNKIHGVYIEICGEFSANDKQCINIYLTELFGGEVDIEFQ